MREREKRPPKRSPAKAGERLFVPANMRGGLLICIGKANEDWNCSAPRGAGHLMSRFAAFERLTMAEYEVQMAGVCSACIVPDTLDELPMAYKSLDEIVESIGPTAEIVCRIKPIHNFKTAEEQQLQRVVHRVASDRMVRA